MNQNLAFDFVVDKANHAITIKREFAAGLPLVWDAWTAPEILDQWWAPKPWKSKTKSMEFKVPGHRLYAMCGPNGEEHWGLTKYTAIQHQQSFAGYDSFSDEHANVNKELPVSAFTVSFAHQGENTLVENYVVYENLEQLETTIKMGFKEGMTMALENLDEYIKQQFKLRSALKTDHKARVTTYLNFPGNTEEAFNFYKAIFETAFSGRGIQRFGDIPTESGHPPVDKSVANLILHIELPILGGHILMASDSPKEMGFTLNQGNNMHISLEPDSRAETQRLFDALSEGGNITMPLQDMFFGSFFGTCIDKFGINWMFNFQNV